jgi:hypothetical protein
MMHRLEIEELNLLEMDTNLMKEAIRLLLPMNELDNQIYLNNQISVTV